MTSEEIKNLKRGFGDPLDWTEDWEQFAHRSIDGIWEIAYQLAVMNERASSVPKQWKCSNAACRGTAIGEPWPSDRCLCGGIWVAA